MLRRPLESALDASIAVVDEVRRGLTSVQRLLERTERQVAAQRRRDSPADDRSREDVDDERHIDEARPGRDVGDVGDPELVRAARVELAVHEIHRPLGGSVGHGRPGDCRAPHDAAKAERAHQALDRAARHGVPLSPELLPDLLCAVDGEILVVDAPHLGHELLIALRSCRAKVRVSLPSGVRVVRRRGDRQHLADRLDPVDVAVLVDEGHHHFGRRSSSA